MQEYISFNYIKENKLFAGYFLNKRKLEELAKKDVVRTNIKNNALYYCVEDIKVYIKELDSFFEEHISLKALAIEEFAIKPYAKQIRDIAAFFNKLGIKVTKHQYIPLNQPHKYIAKRDYELFKHKYIKFKELFEQQNFHALEGNFFKELKEENVEIIDIYPKFNYMYINRNDFNNVNNLIIKSSTDDVSFEDARVKLDLSDSKKNFSIVLHIYKIDSYRGKYKKNYIRNKDMDFLLKEQKKVLSYLRENFYSLDDLREIFEKELGSKVPEKISKFRKIAIPIIAKTKEFKNKAILYDKSKVIDHKNNLERENRISNLLKITSTDYINLLYDFLDIYDYKFENNNTITMFYWHKYLLRLIEQSSATHETLINNISMYAKITLLMDEITNDSRELFDFTEKELRLRIFNEKIYRNYRDVIFRFIGEFNEVLIERKNRIISTDNLGVSIRKSEKDKAIYDLEEYIQLCHFISDYNYHKERALQIIKEQLIGKSSVYKDYTSYWLYILIHLNNGFRKREVINFPKSNESVLTYLDVHTIEQLESINIDKKQARYIVKMYQVKWYKHNKNLEESPFYCSEMLALSFSYCVLYCEFIASMNNIDTGKLITFSTAANLPNKVINRYFFKDFSNNKFLFESRKMTKTVLTLINTVLNKNGNLDLINVARHLRGHVTIETTKFYISIPQKHFDMVVNQLFEIGSFGYVYTELYNKNKNSNKECNEDEKIQFIYHVKELFGGVSQIELLLNKITFIQQQRRESKNYIDSLNREQIDEKLKQLSLGLAFIKDHNYQCLFNHCLNINYDCNKCPFAIPNWYELVTIINRMGRNILNYKNALINSEYQIGELKKIYNLILLDLDKIIQGSKTYGKELIELLLEQSFEEYAKELIKLPDPLTYKE